ncbi:MAG: HAD family hydrolase [Bowdeniella nasicola]|nr:HAD family hydrolase [Bowdeniella nasicola]
MRQVQNPRLQPPATLAAPADLFIALDIDGTIVDYDGRLLPVVRRGIDAACRRGATVILATGRGISGVLPIAKQLGLTSGYAVCSNGAVVIELNGADHYEITDVVTFDPSHILRELREAVPGALFLVDDHTGMHHTTAPFPPGELPAGVPEVSFERACSFAATRVTLRAPELSAGELHRLVATTGLHNVSYSVGWTAWMDISPKGVSKASALEMIRTRLDLPAHGTVAVGDGTNDMEMLRWAHWSVAMGQAMDDVIATADAVTTSIDEAGLAFVLQALLKGR